MITSKTLKGMKIGQIVKADMKYVEPLDEAEKHLQDLNKMLSTLFATHSLEQVKTEYDLQLGRVKQLSHKLSALLQDIPEKA